MVIFYTLMVIKKYDIMIFFDFAVYFILLVYLVSIPSRIYQSDAIRNITGRLL